MFLVGIRRVFFLQMARVWQEQVGKIHRGRCGEDLPTETLVDETGNVAGVVQMSVREHQPLNARGVHRERAPVAQAKLFLALEEPAVNKSSARHRLQADNASR